MFLGVSPGKPTITSLVTAKSGNASCNFVSLSEKCSIVYLRRIRFNTVSEPDCNGTCKCLTTLLEFFRTSMTSSVS